MVWPDRTLRTSVWNGLGSLMLRGATTAWSVRPPGAAVAPGVRLLYLDQCYWGALSAPDRSVLRSSIEARVDAGAWIVPLDVARLLETAKRAHGVGRRELISLFWSLSRGYRVRLPTGLGSIAAAAAEREEDAEWVRARTVVHDASVRRWLELLARLPDSAAHDLRSRIDARFGAARHEVPESTRVEDSAAQFSSFLPRRQLMPDHFPSLRLQMALSEFAMRRKSGFQANDVVDIPTLAWVLPYFDVVTMDTDMNNLVWQTLRERPELRPLVRAKIVGKVNHLESSIVDVERVAS